MKVVINTYGGGFGLSKRATMRMAEKGCKAALSAARDSTDKDWNFNWLPDEEVLPRHDPLLVETVELLGPRSNGPYTKLKVVEIPDGTDYIIEEHDGVEWVSEPHRTWS